MPPLPRHGLEGVDAGDGPLPLWRRRVRALVLLALDPAEFSARRYAERDRMDFAALNKDAWRKPE